MRLIRDVKFWDLGGAVYNFLGSTRKKLSTFGTFYQQQTDSRAILVPLSHFFEEVWRRHYDHLSKKQPTSLLTLYDRSLHLKRKLKKVSFEKNLAELAASFGLPLIDPVAWVLAGAREASIPMVHQATTHGDLHGDNLFVDGEHAWAIDFERTGRGHILRDFVELETDIITRLALLPDQDPGLLRDFVIAIATPDELSATPRAARRVWENPETCKALDVIGALRKLAHDVTGCSDTQEYLWGVLLDALFVAALAPNDSPQRKHALALSSIFCSRLERWGVAWPPEEWLTIPLLHPRLMIVPRSEVKRGIPGPIRPGVRKAGRRDNL